MIGEESYEFKVETKLDSKKKPIGTRYFINDKVVTHIGSASAHDKTEWEKPENLKGEYLPLEGFPVAKAQCAPCRQKLLGKLPFDGYLVKTPEELIIYRVL